MLRINNFSHQYLGCPGLFQGRLSTGLGFSLVPPLWVPMLFFVTAPIFGVLASILILVSGADALLSRWDPYILAAIHCATLGYITMVMMGASIQLLPVLVGTPIPTPKVFGLFVHGFMTLGILALVSGFILGNDVFFRIAVVLLGLVIFVFTAMTLMCLVQAPSRNYTAKGARLAMLALLITACLGILLVEARIGGNEVIHPFNLTNNHLIWGFMGWIIITLATVSYEIVPMFQHTPQYSVWTKIWLQRIILGLLIAGFGISLIIPSTEADLVLPLRLIYIALMMCLMVFASQTLYLQMRSRKLNNTDSLKLFWHLSMSCAVVCAIGMIFLLALNMSYQYSNIVNFLGILFILGVVISAIIGMLYKIIPFLIWFHLQQNKNVSFRPPNMNHIIPQNLALQHFYLHLFNMLFLLLSFILASWLINVTVILFALSSLILLKNTYIALRKYRRFIAR